MLKCEFIHRNSCNNLNIREAAPGDVRFVDQNEDGVIDILDRTFIGNPNPDFVYGFNVNFKLKGFTANFLFNGAYGNDIANGNLIKLNNAEGLGTNISPNAYNNAWRPGFKNGTIVSRRKRLEHSFWTPSNWKQHKTWKT